VNSFDNSLDATRPRHGTLTMFEACAMSAICGAGLMLAAVAIVLSALA